MIRSDTFSETISFQAAICIQAICPLLLLVSHVPEKPIVVSANPEGREIVFIRNWKDRHFVAHSLHPYSAKQSPENLIFIRIESQARTFIPQCVFFFFFCLLLFFFVSWLEFNLFCVLKLIRVNFFVLIFLLCLLVMTDVHKEAIIHPNHSILMFFQISV